MPAGEVVLDIPARSAMVSTARLVVARLASARRELPADRVDDLKLAVSEACSNAIESYRPEPSDQSQRVSVGWAEDDDALHVWVTDQGCGLGPDGLGADEDRPAGSAGLGMGLIRALVDESVYTDASPGTVVEMIMHCPRVDTECY